MSVESIETVVDAHATCEDSRTTKRSFAIAARLPWIAIAQILVVAAILLAVQLAVDYGLVKRIYLASPTQILAAFPQLFARENLLYHLSMTLAEAAVGVGLSAVLGIATGIAMGLFPKVPACGTTKADASNQWLMDRLSEGRLPFPMALGNPPEVFVPEGSDPEKLGEKYSPEYR